MERGRGAGQYLQALPEIANGTSKTVWVLPAELSRAMSQLGAAFGRPAE